MSMEPPKGALTIDAVERPLDAVVRPPGSKSIAARALIAAALAEGRSILDGFGFCDDTERLIEGLAHLGIPITIDRNDERVEVTGCGGRPPAIEAEIDCGESGTMLRFCTALCALGIGDFRLIGAPRLGVRPLEPLIRALRQLGAVIECLEQEGHAPLVVHGRGLMGGEADIDGSTSSQYASALLLCGPVMRRDLFLEITGEVISRPYIALTTAVMREFGVELVARDNTRFVVPAPQFYTARNYRIEPDASTASYFLAAAAICGGRVRIEGLGASALQGDIRAIELLAAMGCQTQVHDDRIELSREQNTQLLPLVADLGDVPDLVPTFSVCALFAHGTTHLTNIAHLQHKESKRLDVLADGLRQLGATVHRGPDHLTIEPPASFRSAAIATAGDHRMAMAFALAGLGRGRVEIDDAGCVAKSCPTYFSLLGQLG